MKTNVYITGHGSCILKTPNEKVTINRENRKIMRFSRLSGRMFLTSLYEAVKLSGWEKLDDPFKGGVFFGDFMNLTTDKEHRTELLNICREMSDCFDQSVFLNHITKNWSAVEVLKEVPNIPCFLAAQMLNVNGHSETILNTCASGLTALGRAAELISSGVLDTAFVGAGSAKLDDIEMAMFRSQGLYDSEDYSIVNGGAALVLESERQLKKRGGKPLARIISWSDIFAPNIYHNRKYDVKAAELLIKELCLPPDRTAIGYTVGSFSKRLLDDEINTVKRLLPFATIHLGYKNAIGYSFAASGLVEISNLLKNGADEKENVIASIGYGGQQAAVHISMI